MDRKNIWKTIAGILLFIGFILIVIGLVITFIFLFNRSSEKLDPNDELVIPLNQTITEGCINFTLEEGNYEIWFEEYYNPGNISISVNGIHDNIYPQEDYWIIRNGTKYFRIYEFKLSETSNISINKSTNDKLYITNVLYTPVDFTPVWFAIKIIVIGFVLILPFMVIMIYSDRDVAKRLKESRKRERQYYSKVKIDLRNPKQFFGAIIFFIISPILFSLNVGYIIVTVTKWWSQFVLLPIWLFSLLICVTGFHMFYNSRIIRKGGVLSLKKSDDSNIYPSYQQCAFCSHINILLPEGLEKNLKCDKCKRYIIDNGVKAGGSKLNEVKCPNCHRKSFLISEKKWINCPYCNIDIIIN